LDQQRIIFESSPGFILVCVLLAVGGAYLLYRGNHPWSRNWNYALFGIRAVVAFLMLFLLLGPIVKQVSNLFDKPVFVLVLDNSISVKETNDSLSLLDYVANVRQTAQQLEENGYDVRITDLAAEDIEGPVFDATTSDINGTLKKVMNRFESKQISGVVLVSDGIYNEGISPIYATYPFPVYAVGVGDTTQRTDIFVKDVAYNKIVYQGNRFPIRVSVVVSNLEREPVRVSLLHRGRILDQQTKEAVNDQLVVFDFEPTAEEQGIQKLDIQIEAKPEEFNTANNHASVYVEVVEGKKKILLVAASPHPDIKALREVVDKNPNYEFLLHVPGIEEQPPSVLAPSAVDLAIFHQSPDVRGRTRELFQRFAASKTALFLIVGAQTDLALMEKFQMPVTYETAPRDYDEVVPVSSPVFSHFVLTSETNNVVLDYPPVSVPFGKVKTPGSATSILFQKVGSLATEKPLLYVANDNDRRIAVMLGEGLWRWKLNEFDRFENSVAFDELFGKLVQYLSTADDKRKFRSYPVKQEFSDTEAVSFESQVYNDIFEPVFGNTIDIEVTDENGRKREYNYMTNPGNVRYQIGGLKEGVYRYRSSTEVGGSREEVRGEFAVVQKQAEHQNLTADFDLLRKLSVNTGGKFYRSGDFAVLRNDLSEIEAKSIIHSEESYSALVNLKWVFWLLLFMASVEWFTRKYFGGY
jgi:hypothetical protein